MPALLVDVEGRIIFFNDAAAEVVGSPFEEIGTMTREQWNARYGPLDGEGRVELGREGDVFDSE